MQICACGQYIAGYEEGMVINMKNIKVKKSGKTKIVMYGFLLPIMVLMCACGVTPDASETINMQLVDRELQDDLLYYGSTVEYIFGIIEKEYLETDYELKEELTLQLLRDKNMDTSIINSTRKTKGCTFTLPEGFEESEDMTGMYLNEHYPVDASTIYYKEMDQDASLQLMSKEIFLENMKKKLERSYGSGVDLEIQSFEKIEISGFPSFKILYDYSNGDVAFTHLQYIINADKTYVITYSQTDEYDRMEEFAESAETIQVE